MSVVEVEPFFTPTQISGCAIWLDGADSTTVSQTNAQVSQWRDKSGNSRNFSQATSTQQPIYSNNSLLFDGVDDLLTGPDYVPVYSNPATFNVFVVGNALTISLNNANPYDNEAFMGDSGGYHSIFVKTNTVGGYYYDSANAVLQTTQSYTANTLGIFNISLQDALFTLYQNGTSSSTSGTLPIKTSGVSSLFQLGAQFATGATFNRYLNCRLYEVIIYNTSLTTGQRQQIEGYLAWKWGLQASLPSNHPYNTSPISPLANPPIVAARFLENDFFTPTQVSGCQLWLDGYDRNTFTFSGSNVTQWRDKSATNTTANTSNGATANPILFRNGGIYINNNSSQAYNASTYSMMAIQSNIMTTADLTMIIVVNNPSNDTSALLSDPRAVGVSETRTQLNHGFVYEVSTGGVARATSPTTAAGTGTRILIGTSSPAQSQFFNNGTLTGLNTTAITTYSSDLGGLPTLGGYRNTETGGSDNSWFTGTVFEVIFYTVALTGQQRQQIEGYLAWKWGLQASLPGDHPYKTSPIAPLVNPSNLPAQIVSASWQPTQISTTDIQLWLDAADPTANGTVPIEGAPVSSWSDKSGKNRSMTTILLNAGTITYSRFRNIPSILFNSTYSQNTNGAYMRVDSLVNLLNFTVFTVVSSRTTQTNQSSLLAIPAPGVGIYEYQSLDGFGHFIDPDSGKQRDRFYGGGTGVNNELLNSNPSDSVFTYPLRIMCFTNTSAGVIRSWFNGNTGTTRSGSARTSTATGFGIGFDIGGSPQVIANLNTQSFFSECVVYNVVLTDGQRQQVEGYLAWKWGLQSNLPSNHPYKLYPPSP